jgi:molybdopterin synthase sulfur carrier subunit
MNAGNRRVSDAPATGLIRYWAAAREAAGTSEEPYACATLEEALAAAIGRHGDALRRVLAHCSFVVDGTPVSRRDPGSVMLSTGGTIEVLPPFAGGAPRIKPPKCDD